MSVNIFGSSGKSDKTLGINKKYVDSKFISLTRNLELKVNKDGDVMNGSLDMGNYKISSTHIPTNPEDLINKGYGDNNYIYRSGGSLDMGPNKITSSYVPKEDIDLTNKNYVDNKFVFKTNYGHLRDYVDKTMAKKSGDVMSGDLSMGSNKIINVADPRNPQDVSTKKYVDEKTDIRYVKCSVGLVPPLINNNNKNGFIVSASSEETNIIDGKEIIHHAFHAFAPEKLNWLTGNINADFWIQLKCPEQYIIHKIALRGPSSERTIYQWKVQGSDGGGDWNELANFTNLLDNHIKFFNIPQNSPTAYRYFRLFFTSATTNALHPIYGLSHWQLYPVDQFM